MIVVAIEGGPSGLDPIQKVDAQTLPDRFVLPYYGHHQHFERTEETAHIENEEVPVFRWTYRTAIAE